MRAEVFRDSWFFAIDRPTQRRALINRVPDVQTRTSFYKQLHYLSVVGADCLMERRRMGMKSIRVVTIWIFTGIDE